MSQPAGMWGVYIPTNTPCWCPHTCSAPGPRGAAPKQMESLPLMKIKDPHGCTTHPRSHGRYVRSAEHHTWSLEGGTIWKALDPGGLVNSVGAILMINSLIALTLWYLGGSPIEPYFIRKSPAWSFPNFHKFKYFLETNKQTKKSIYNHKFQYFDQNVTVISLIDMIYGPKSCNSVTLDCPLILWFVCLKLQVCCDICCYQAL